MRRALPVALALTAASAATADAATLRTDRQCYIPGQPLTVSGSGWAPGSGWSVFGGGLDGSGTADGAGAFAFATEAPDIEQTTRPRTLTLAGSQDGAAVAKTTFKVVSFLVEPEKPDGRVTGRTSWSMSGFGPGQPIFFHVKRGKRAWTQKAGRGDRTCGTLTTRLRRLPAVPERHIGYGTYKLFVDNRRKLERGTGLQYRATITIERS